MHLCGVFCSIFSSEATPHPHHHHHPTLLSLLQQSRKFVAVGEVAVAIETDACCQSPPPPLSSPLSPLNFSP